MTNSGNVTLSGPFTVTDDKATDQSCPATATLDPGDQITCTASYTITQADLDAGSLTNVATATAGQVSSNEDGASVTLAGTPTPAPTLKPTIPPTDAMPPAEPPADNLGWLIAASLLMASLVGLTGVVATRRGTARSLLRRR